jgi:hypothetical protein
VALLLAHLHVRTILAAQVQLMLQHVQLLTAALAATLLEATVLLVALI